MAIKKPGRPPKAEQGHVMTLRIEPEMLEKLDTLVNICQPNCSLSIAMRQKLPILGWIGKHAVLLARDDGVIRHMGILSSKITYALVNSGEFGDNTFSTQDNHN